MDLLTRLRAEVPAEVSPRAADRFQAAFAAERSAGPRRATTAALRWRRAAPRPSLARLALAAGLAAAVAAGIVVAIPRSPAHGPVPLTVRELAYRAAAAALARPAVAPGQWLYTKGGHFTNCPKDLHAIPKNGCESTDQRELWQTADYTRRADYEVGRLVVWDNPKSPGQLSYAQALKLPADPQALVKYLYDWQARIAPVTSHYTKSELWLWTFYAMTDLMRWHALPPRVAAELFRALPYVPGIRVLQAPGLVGFTWAGIITSVRLRPESRPLEVPATSQTIVLNPSSYAVTGSATLTPSGKILAILEFPAMIPVSGPGVRP
jgi:hypothetical protein